MEGALLFWGISTAILAASVGQERTVWYVKPTPDSLCPQGVTAQRCHTFYDIFHDATIAEAVFSPNTILAVLGGDHFLNFESEAFLAVRNQENFTLLGSQERTVSPDDITRPVSRIVCVSRFAIAFINSSRILFANLTFSNCGANITADIANEALSLDQANRVHFLGAERKTALMMLNVNTFQMVFCVVENSYGYGLLGVNVLGESTILRSTFYGNNDYTTTLDRCTRSPLHPEDITACSGGNALFLFEDLDQCPPEPTQYTLQIQNSVFLVGVNGFGGRLPDQYLTRGAGLSIILSQSSYGVTVTMDEIVSYGNSALIGANLYIAMYETVDNSTVSLSNSNVMFANYGLISAVNFFEESGSSSGGLHVEYNLPIEVTTVPVCRNKQKYEEEILRITNCSFNQNVALLAGGVFIQLRTSASNHMAKFRIQGCNFTDNVGTSGMALYISEQKGVSDQGTNNVLFEDVQFITNRYLYPIRNLTELATTFQLNVVQVVQARSVSFRNCMFTGNEGTGLSAFGSRIFMFDSITFDGNSGIVGGAVNLEDSYLFFAPHTRVTFRDNYALMHGGAINVIGQSDLTLGCFFQVLDPNYQQDPNVTLYFEGNYAEESGSILYGGAVDRCTVIAQSSLGLLNSTGVFERLVDIGPHSNDTSLISSDSTRVCMCVNSVPVCDKREMNISLLPGVTVDVPFVAMGQRGGITPSTLYVVTDAGTKLGQFQQEQQTGKTCTNLKFTISTVASDAQLIVHTNNLNMDTIFTMNVSIESCPLGFVLDQKGMCACEPTISYATTCDISTQTVFRKAGSWISAYFSKTTGSYENGSYENGGYDSKGYENGSYEGVILFPNCPYDYCHRDGMNLDLTDPDSQCQFNRTGVLCGACKPGLSLPIGTNKCRKCSDSNAALVLVGVILAVGLVALLYILNLTVTAGTVGGLILYANIVYGSNTIFFSTGSNSALLVIISWLNLDSATEICFYNGYNEYARAWLGYAFPFMVWAIVILIILATRCSNTIARVCGSRSVPVLATLLLLSFNRLLREVIISLSFSVITYPDRSLSVVWTNDGNIGFWKGKHIALGVFAVIVLLLFIIPYTLLLVVVPLPCVQAYSTHRVLAWVNKLKPFMDAHHGPYKNNLRNWTGILLLIRILLSILNVVIIRGYDNDVILLVITTVMFLLLSFGWVARGGMYKSWPLNILECSFYLNLGILSAATLFVRQAGGNGQTVVILTSGTIALLELGGIVVYHAYMQTIRLKRLMNWSKQWRHKETSEVVLTSSLTAKPDVTSTTFSLGESYMED